MNYELIELTIHFENKESEYMIVSLDSTAHQLVRDYVQANGYELIEKPIARRAAVKRPALSVRSLTYKTIRKEY